MSDLLKEAIADAKAVRETALQNAKMALEEAFTPQLKSMLSAKLREEEDDESAEEMAYEAEGEDEVEEMGDVKLALKNEEDPEDEMAMEDEMEDEMGEDEEEVEDVPVEDEMEDEMGAEEIPAEEGEEELEEPVAETLEINGHTYRLSEEEEEEVPFAEGEEEEMEEGSNLELEQIIKELEDEMEEEDDEEEVTEEIEKEKTEYEENTSDGYEENVDGDKDEKQVGGDIGENTEYDVDASVLEQSDSSDIGTGDNKVDAADSSDEDDIGAGTDKPGTQVAGNIGESAELKEYKEAVKFLKDKLHEVNILNAKLLFTNKLFKEYLLDNNQKLRVVETFDRAQTVREIKLVYATLAESFKNSSKITTKKSISESASKKSGSTKPVKKIISEEKQVADRFKKLAGLIR